MLRRIARPKLSRPGLAGLGGGVIGAVMLSPFITGTVSMIQYNHYALLLTTEDIFGVAPLG